MGAITSRQHAGVEEVDIVSTHAYKYPPRSGLFLQILNFFFAIQRIAF